MSSQSLPPSQMARLTDTDIHLPASEKPVHVTPNAHKKIAALILEEGDPNIKLRVYVEGGGCSGFQYGFSFETEATEEDICLKYASPDHADLQDIALIIDVMSLQYLTGAEIDYQNDLNGERFIIRNPQAKTTCGCGSSFSTE